MAVSQGTAAGEHARWRGGFLRREEVVVDPVRVVVERFAVVVPEGQHAIVTAEVGGGGGGCRLAP